MTRTARPGVLAGLLTAGLVLVVAVPSAPAADAAAGHSARGARADMLSDGIVVQFPSKFAH